MGRQRESIRVDAPFVRMVRARGWTVYNIHGSAYQAGLPDRYMTHADYAPKWVEFKVIEPDGSIHLTKDQKRVFPQLVRDGVPAWCIAADDLRGPKNLHKRKAAYRKIFEEPNLYLLLNRRTWGML